MTVKTRRNKEFIPLRLSVFAVEHYALTERENYV
jgi:hypothetical protein